MSENKKSILLIGGTGVLSSAVTSEALRQGYLVTMINRGKRNAPAGVEVIVSDKENSSRIRKALEGRRFDAVIDFLCYTKAELEQSFMLYKDYTDQYFFISSCAVYDKASDSGDLRREDAPKGLKIWPYSVNKWDCEKLLVSLADKYGIRYTVVRPCVTYGNTRIPYGISPKYGYHWTLAARVLACKPIIRWNGGDNRSNMMRVEDFASAVVPLVGNERAYGEAFNICGDEIPTFNDVLAVMAEYLGHEVRTIDIPPNFYAQQLPEKRGEILGGRAMDAMNSNAKIKGIVPGWRQKISLAEGVRMTLEAYKERDYQKGIDWAFDAQCDRVIRNWCRKNGIDPKAMNIGFKDYLGNARPLDRYVYFTEYHKDNGIIRVGSKVLNRILRKVGWL